MGQISGCTSTLVVAPPVFSTFGESPSPRALLLNMFGAEYVATVSRLLTMEWLYSERVSGNLARAFGVTLRSD